MKKERKFLVTLICNNFLGFLYFLYGLFSFTITKIFLVSIWGEEPGSVGHHFVSERQSWGWALGLETLGLFPWGHSLRNFPENDRRCQCAASTATCTEKVTKVTLLTYCMKKKRNENRNSLVPIGRRGCIFPHGGKKMVCAISLLLFLNLCVCLPLLPAFLPSFLLIVQIHSNHNIWFSVCKTGAENRCKSSGKEYRFLL